MLNLTRERRQEVTFGLILLLSLPVAMLGLEFAYRIHKAPDLQDRVDWAAMVTSVGVPGDPSGPPRFRPDSTFGILSFNSFGLRGPEPVVPTPADLVRIAFVGDSKMMSANYPEHLTLSGQTTAALEALVPQCRFDYVTMAGPEYDMRLLAGIWAEVAPVVQPDMAVLLVGSVEELVNADHDLAGMGQDGSGGTTWMDDVMARSHLLRAVQRQIRLANQALMPDRPVDLDLAALSRAYWQAAAPLVDTIGTTPTLALGYRSRLRADQPQQLQARYSQNMMAALPGRTVAEIVALADFKLAEQARQARAAGWVFEDAIAGMPTDDTQFVDDSHFSDIGLAYLADRISAVIAPAIQADCTVAFIASDRGE